MRTITKYVLFIATLMCIPLASWCESTDPSENSSAEDAAGEKSAQDSVEELVAEMQSIVKKNGTQGQYKPILLQYFDFVEISKNVLAGVFKEIKNAKDADAAVSKINDFLPDFIPVFTDYMITKYSKPEITDKFKTMTFQKGKVYKSGKYISVNTKFQSTSGDSLGDINVEWKLKNNKIVDMVFSDAAASIFKNEGSEATSNYLKAGSNLDEMLKQYK
jgi:ABC-type transporter MlaC component